MIKMHNTIFVLLLSAYFGFVLNLPLIMQLFGIFNKLEQIKIGFVISIPILFISIFNFLFTFFSIKYFEKTFFIALVLLSSLVSYAMYHYGIVFDINMIKNIMETDYREAVSYLSVQLIVWILFFGIVPSAVIYKVDVIHSKIVKDVIIKFISIIVSLSIVFAISFFYYKDYSFIARNNSNLKRMIVPTYYLYGIYKYIDVEFFQRNIEYEYIGLDAESVSNSAHSKQKNLLVIVVGETARSMNYQLNGYNRETNKHSKGLKNLVSFESVTSCGTSTAVSLPCMFSTATRNTYSDNLAGTRDNLLDILKRAGLNTLWVDNNSGCKDVCKNIRTIEVKTEKSAWCGGNYCFDEILLTNLQKYINEMDGKDSVIVLHLIGSHGPNYYKRYPEKHRYFSPDCKSVDLQSCTNEALINSYDNTILYTDFVLTNIIKILESNSASWNSFMMYISDHGESLGEYGIYLHGAPYSVAPIEQIKVPYIVWLSTQFLKVKNIDIECLSNKAKENNYSHDNLFHSVLGIMDIKTKIYEEEMDVFKSCRKS